MSEPRFTVSAEELKVEALRRRYCDLLAQPEVYPSEDNWQFIISHRLSGLGPGLYRKFLVARLLDETKRCDYHQLALKHFPRYLSAIDREEAVTTVYSDILTDTRAFIELVKGNMLFDSEQIGRLVDDGYPDIAAELLDSYQPDYDGDALDAMQALLTKFDSLPSLGTIELCKGVFKTERRYICPDGHSNPHDELYCRTPGCGKDIRGLTASQRKLIELFAERIEILREMLG